jgi:hypothetical protein
MKKLIPALCMLLVAACLMGTSTYAWFSASESVNASGMQVKAMSDGGLAIASYKGAAGTTPQTPGEADFASAYTLNVAGGDWVNGASAIKPASWNGTDWFAGTSATADSATADNLTKLGTTYADLADYMQHTKWKIKSLKDGATVKVGVTAITVTAEGGSSVNLDKALRVAIKTGEQWYIFAPSYTTDQAATLTYVDSYVGTTGTNSGDLTLRDVKNADGDVIGQEPAINTGNSNIKGGTAYSTTAVIFAALGTAAQDIDVYVYYEGQDSNCRTAFATNINTLKVAIDYEVID